MEATMFNEILLRRRNKLNVQAMVDSKIDNIDRAIIMVKNIESLGYTFDKNLFEYVRHISVKSQNKLYIELIACLKEYTGANKSWEAFYPNFPEQVEQAEDWELFVNAVIHYMSGGKLIPQYEKDERLPLFESTELKVIGYAEEGELDEIMNNLITSKTSLSETDKTDMIWLIQNLGVNANELPDEIPFKENVAVICKLIMDNTSEIEWYDILHKYLKTATDILRFVTYLSDGDVSLATNTKYKSLPRKKRRLILRLLDNTGSIEEDMKRHESKWIKLGETLHAGEYKQYNNAYTAFDKLRNNGKIATFTGKVNALLSEKNLDKALSLLKTRPGELARRLDSLLRDYPYASKLIINVFKEVSDKISVPVLLQVKEHFIWRNEENNSRVFFPKGQLTKCYTIENNLKNIYDDTCWDIYGICINAITEQFKSKESLGKVYIDDSIKGYCVPQSQRSASKSMRNITRGSRFKIKDDSNFIRLGIHWVNELTEHGYESRTDIDLSCTFLDKNFSKLDHTSWTNLRNGYSTHSGDFVDAPRDKGGAAEFIDINISKAIKTGVKYAAVQIYGYTHTKFCDLDDMLFNWQEGKDTEKELCEIFEASRLQQSINLGFDSDCGIPVIFDLENREVIWCDLALTTRTNFPRCAEGNVKGLSATAMGIVQSHKPQMSALAEINALARGTIVDNRDEADTIFDINTEKPIIRTEKFIEIQNEKGEVIGTRVDVEEHEKECRIITPYDIDIWVGEMM